MGMKLDLVPWLFENRILKRMFRPKRVEVVGDCMQVDNEELHYL
jgi:hypothetical protein